MTRYEKNILGLLVKFLKKEILFQELDSRWVELYIENEKDEYSDIKWDDLFSEISELIYMTSVDVNVSTQDKSDGILTENDLRNKIEIEFSKEKLDFK